MPRQKKAPAKRVATTETIVPRQKVPRKATRSANKLNKKRYAQHPESAWLAAHKFWNALYDREESVSERLDKVNSKNGELRKILEQKRRHLNAQYSQLEVRSSEAARIVAAIRVRANYPEELKAKRQVVYQMHIDRRKREADKLMREHKTAIDHNVRKMILEGYLPYPNKRP